MQLFDQLVVFFGFANVQYYQMYICIYIVIGSLPICVETCPFYSGFLKKKFIERVTIHFPFIRCVHFRNTLYSINYLFP